jgi:hypothetical protein
MQSLRVICQTCPSKHERRRSTKLFTANVPGVVLEQCKRELSSHPQRAQDALTHRLLILSGAGEEIPGLAFAANTTVQVNTTSNMPMPATISDVVSQLLHPEPWLVIDDVNSEQEGEDSSSLLHSKKITIQVKLPKVASVHKTSLSDSEYVTGAASADSNGGHKLECKRHRPAADDNSIEIDDEEGNSKSTQKKSKTQQQRVSKGGKDKQRTRGGRILILRQYFAAAAPRLNEDTPEGLVITQCLRRFLTAARQEGSIVSNETQLAKALTEGAKSCIFTRAMAKLVTSFLPTQKGVIIRKVLPCIHLT